MAKIYYNLVPQENCLVLKGGEALSLSIPDWLEVSCSISASLINTGNFDNVDTQSGELVTAETLTSPAREDYFYFGLKDNNKLFPQEVGLGHCYKVYRNFEPWRY